MAGSYWLPLRNQAGGGGVALYAFPYAGGSAAVYHRWRGWLPAGVDVRPIELAGHGRRLGERPLASIQEIAGEIAAELGPRLAEPYLFYGHSMGAILAFEVLRLCAAAGLPGPLHLFVGACRPPHVQWRPNRAGIHELDDRAFLDEVRKWDGAPEEVLADRELMKLLMPGLRADFRAFEEYEFRLGEALRCPVTAFGGLRDHRVRAEHLAEWKATTDGPFELEMIPGHHFFVAQERALFLPLLAKRLEECMRRHALGPPGPRGGEVAT